MKKHFEIIQEENPKIDYEYIFCQTTKDTPFYVKKIDNLIWCGNR